MASFCPWLWLSLWLPLLSTPARSPSLLAMAHPLLSPTHSPTLPASPDPAIARAHLHHPHRHPADPIPTAPSASSPVPPSAAAMPESPPFSSPNAIAEAPAFPPSFARAPSSSADPPASPPPPSSSKPLPAISSVSPSSPPSPAAASLHPLDPAQLAALRTLGIHVGTNPCTSPSMRDTLVCDKGSPERHVIALHLQLCARDAVLKEEALQDLETLKALSFLDCPMLPARMPGQLLSSLTSLTCIASLGATANTPDAPALGSTWLSEFENLSELAVVDVHVNGSGLPLLIWKMKHLKELKFSNTNITGILPMNTWPANLTYVDLAFNALAGSIPLTLTKLNFLIELDLSNNRLSGNIPNTFAKMKGLQKLSLASNSLSGPFPSSLSNLSSSLIYLDLSNNKLSGSIPQALNNMKSLRYLDLSHNHFSGQLPFDQTFFDKLNTFKVRGNLGICYDHSLLTSPFLEGVPDCDSSGMPIVPSTLSLAPPPGEGFAPSQPNFTQGSPSHHHRGPRTIIAAVAITLVVVIVFIVVVVLVSRCRERKY